MADQINPNLLKNIAAAYRRSQAAKSYLVIGGLAAIGAFLYFRRKK